MRDLSSLLLTPHVVAQLKSFLRNIRFSGIILCVGSVLLYLAQTLPNLSYPGVHFEEAAPVIPVFKLLGYPPLTTYYAHLSPSGFPLNQKGYHGPLESYFALPFIYYLGNTAEAVRLPVILLGAATILLFFGLAFVLTQSINAAGFASFLLAMHPAFVTSTREGMRSGTVLYFVLIGALFCGFSWRQNKARGVFLYMAAFLLGLGMNSRSYFLFCLLPLLFLFRSDLRELSLKRAAISVIVFLAGTFPFIVHIVETKFLMPTWRLFANPSPGVDNLAYLNNIAVRLGQVLEILRGDFPLKQNFPDATVGFRLHWPLLCGALLWTLLSPFLAKQPRPLLKAQRFFIAYAALFFICSPFTLSELKPPHLFTLIPIAVILSVLALTEIQQLFIPRRGSWFFCMLAVVFFLLDKPQVQTYCNQRARPSPDVAPSVHELAAWVRERKPATLWASDWSLQTRLSYLAPRAIYVLEPGTNPKSGDFFVAPGASESQGRQLLDSFRIHARNIASLGEEDSGAVYQAYRIADR